MCGFPQQYCSYTIDAQVYTTRVVTYAKKLGEKMNYLNTFKTRILFGIAVFIVCICGCERVQDMIVPETDTSMDAVHISVSMVYPERCLGDMAYCDQLQKGIRAAEQNLNIDIAEAEGTSGTWETLLREAAQTSDLVITAGFQLAKPILKVAPEFPDVNFVLIDTLVDLPNVTSVTYKENEGSYLVGAIAALKTGTGKIGYIGAADVPLLHKFEAGYVAGAQSINPDIEIVVEYIAKDGSGFSQPLEAKRLANHQYESGIDIIYTVAAGAGLGAVEAAKTHQRYIIWVDDNINATAPDVFLTSKVKRVDKSISDVVLQFAAGNLIAGPLSLGLKEDGVAYALDEHNRPHLSDEIITTVEALKAQIIAGDIVVPTVPLPRQ